MKKLMIAAAIVCAAAMSHAAQFAWGFDNTENADHNGVYLEGGTALLYLGTVSYSASSGWNTSAATLLATSAWDGEAYTFGPISAAASNPTSDKVSSNGGDAYTLILTEANGVAKIDGYEGYYFLETGTSTQAYYMSGTDPVYVGKMVSSTLTSGIVGEGGNWALAQAVPEPTSGLLLLLGMAGLALKRKRA